MTLEKTSVSVFMLKSAALPEVQKTLFTGGTALSGGLDGWFVALPAQRKPPRWFRAVLPHLGGTSPQVFGESPAGMLLVHRPRCSFVITFGHAWQRIEYRWVELDFGRRVALNAIPPDRVLEVSSQQVFAKKHLARERAPHATSVSEFAIEYDRDLLGALEGVPRDNLLGTALRGSMSLRASVHFPTLGSLLDRAAMLFASKGYKKHWPDVDNIVPISDDALALKLDMDLDTQLQSGAAKSKAVLFSPSFIRGDLTSADGFAIGSRSAKDALSPYLLYGSWESYLARSKKTPSLAHARSTPVHLFDEGGERIERSSVYQCLTYELSHAGKQYVLSSGVWYEADEKFMQRVDGYIAGMKASPFALPAWNGSEHEGVYNTRCCKGGELLHFDAKNVQYGGGRSKFEFCDFMHPRKKILFFAKIAAKAAGCSHLVEQVRRTEELLFDTDGTYRSKLKEIFKRHHPSAKRTWLDDRPTRGEWKLCLVSLGRKKEDLPFFAKCAVWRLARNLERLGHTVYFATV
jgi:uncharacterized protein (TIGR04141 family)